MVLPPIPIFPQGWYWGPRPWLKAEWPLFMLWALEWDFSSRSYLGGFFPLWEKTGSDKLTGPFQRYHNPKASLSPGYLFTQEPVEKGGHKKNAGKKIYHQSVQYIQGSSFYLVSTYLQIMSSGCPIYNNWGGTVRASHFGPIPRLSSHRGSVVSQSMVGSVPLPWQPLGLTFSDGRQLHLLCAHLLSTEGWLFPWTCVRLHTVVQELLPRNTRSTISLGKKIWAEVVVILPIYVILHENC